MHQVLYPFLGARWELVTASSLMAREFRDKDGRVERASPISQHNAWHILKYKTIMDWIKSPKLKHR